MPARIGFDNDTYLAEQSAEILRRIGQFGDKLFLEFGGKLLYDYHAARVLPGFDPNVKMRLLQKLADQVDIILCIHAGDIEHKKMRADFGISYDADALKLIDDLREWGIEVTAVVITRFEEQPAAIQFKNKLERRGIAVFTHKFTKGYPTHIEMIVSEEGYGANAYIPTAKPIVVVTGPGPGSGKLATALSQLYHERKRGIRAGYAKFETFPIWNLPLKHPVNVAYEAATADLRDFNMIDSHHLEAYNERTVNYNRDVEAFPLLRRIIEKITGEPCPYKSPTDMGVNRAGFGIIDDSAVREAAVQEIIRRYFRYTTEYALGMMDKGTVERAELIMEEIGARPEDRPVVVPARRAAGEAQRRGKGNEGIFCGAAVELPDGTIITGMNSPLLHSSAALILNAAKHLAGIPARIDLLPKNIIESLSHFKRDVLEKKRLSLDLEETLIALSISGANNPAAQAAVEKLKELRGCDVHTTHIPAPGDEAGLRKLGLNLTCDPDFASRYLFLS
ncbi:MAG TPA: DUF1846 domain-containing protein [bacterium]|nr:DUF1846 domain-containing protein [bacterium]HQI47448.1 DUF1846 domain-containing protein [bacterium]HQJ64661.1 DUF1846 domain-containing protein [bacterium]